MTKQEAWIGVFRSAIARHNVNDRYQIDGKEVFLAGWAKFFADYAIEHMPEEEGPSLAKWEDASVEYLYNALKCSHCHVVVRERTPYCPHCGAKMEAEA